MVRAPFFDENGVKRGAWSHEEDEKLRSYIQSYGHWNWRELPKFAGLKRCGKSCRLRWVNYLQPNVKRGNYTKEEERLIGKLHEEFGKKWSLIAAQLPGRTDNEIKNYWHTHMKNRGKKTRKADYEKANETSEHEDNQSTESETKNILATLIIPSNQILESSPLSPETSCLSSTSNSANVLETKCVSEEIINSFESFPQCSGDFWTEPFVSDNSYFPNEYQSTYLSPFVSYDTDSMDLFYQVMQELSENNAYI